MKVVIAGGGWSTNIGNAFFNLGTEYVLRQVLPEADFLLMSDQPAYLDFFRRKAPRNSLNLFHYIKAEYIVLHGSVLTRHLPQVWGQALSIMCRAGTRVIFISAGLFEYSEAEIGICRQFLADNPPFLFVSRDAETYRHLGDCAQHSYDGIDSAFFLPEAFSPHDFGLCPYVIFNFDKSPEPFVKCFGDNQCAPGAQRVRRGRYSTQFEFKGSSWEVTFPVLRYCLSKRLSKFYPYLISLAPFGDRRPETTGDYMIVRTDHQFNPVYPRKIFRYPNSFCWDIPDPYLCLYANAELTLADRIHAAVAALAYGRPAMLFSESGRSRIIDRVGGGELSKEPVMLDQALLKYEKDRMLDFLSEIEF